MRGLKWVHGRPAAERRPLIAVDPRRAVATLSDIPAGGRDRALIVVGFAAALRRSELAGLEVTRRSWTRWATVIQHQSSDTSVSSPSRAARSQAADLIR